MKDFTDSILEKQKKKEEGTFKPRRDRTTSILTKRTAKNINFDTFESDLKSTSESLTTAFGGWQTQETMKTTKDAAQSMYGRLGEYEYYLNLQGMDTTDVTNLRGAYKYYLDNFDDQGSLYGKYKNADAYNTEQTKLTELYSMSSEDIKPYVGKKGKEVAYTTVDGYAIKWDDLYSSAKTSEIKQDVTARPDYAEKSKYKKKDVTYKTTTWLEPVGSYANAYYITHTIKTPSDEDAFLYNYINGDEDARGAAELTNIEMFNTYDFLRNKYFKEEEISVFNALWEESPEKAKEYVSLMESDLSARRINFIREQDEKRAREDPFGSSVASVLASPFVNTVAGIGMLVDMAEDGEIDEKSALYNNKRSQDTTRGTVEGMIDNDIGKFIYRHGMNLGDNLSSSAVGGFGLMGGVSKFLSLTPQVMGAYVDTTLDAKERGLSDEKAIFLGTISGTAEAFFESKTFDAFFGGDLTEDGWKYLVKNIGTELAGELGTEAVNDVSDILISQDLSTWQLSVDGYIKSGMTKKEAFNKAFDDAAIKYYDIAAGTIFSSGAMAGPSAIGIQSQNTRIGRDIRESGLSNDVFDMANNPEFTDAYNAYTAYANKGINADNIKDSQLGGLYRSINYAAQEGFKTADRDIDKAKKTIAKQKNIRESGLYDETDVRYKNATSKLDKAIANQSDAQVRRLNNAEVLSKLSDVDNKIFVTKFNKAVEEENEKSRKALEAKEAKEKAKHEAEVKKLSSGVETSVMANTDKAIEIKGVKDKNTLITSEGEVAFEDVKLSENDARLFDYARGMSADEASLYYENYDGKTDVEEYTNDFNRVIEYAKHSGYSENYILENAGSLSGKQVSAIYENTVIAEARHKEAENKKLMETTASGAAYTGKIDDSIIDYKNTSAEGKINWNSLNQRQRSAVDFLKVFAAKSGMNLKFTPYSDTENGAFDIKDNTIYVSLYAGISYKHNRLRDTIIPTASHEITHWMEEKSPELYVKLKDTVLDALAQAKGESQADIIDAEIRRLDRTHKDKKHTEKDAVNEIVARACEDMLAMSEEGRKMFDSMTDAEKKTFVEKVKEILENLMKWIDEFLSSYKSETAEARALRDYKDKLAEISKIWDEMLVHSIEVNQALEKADVFEHLDNGVSEDGTTIVGKNNLQMSDKTYREGGRDFLVNWLEGQSDLSEEDKRNIVEQTDRVAEIMRAIDEGGEIPDYSRWANLEVVKDENGEKVLSVIVKNGDYAMNIDFSQVCKKRVALDNVLNAMVQQGVLDVVSLTESDMAELNAVIKEHEFEIACALCFFDAKRYRVNAWADSFCEGSDEKKSGKTIHKYGFNEMVRSLIPEGSKINVDEFNFTNRDIKNQPTKNLLSEAKDTDLDFTLIDKIMAENDSASAQHRYAKAIKENPEIRKTLNSAEIISSIGLDAIRLEAPKLYGLINGHQGTAKPKFAHSMVAYGNDVLKASNFTPEKARMVGGVRCQSFSDFMASMVVDYAQFVSELAAKKLTAHSYTKEPLFVKLFGLTGMKINMSLVPKAIDMTPEQQKQFAILKDKEANKKSKAYKDALAEYMKLTENAGLDENGNYIWEDETFPYDIAMEIVVDKRYSKNCGTIAVGISNNHIKKLLADPRISMVIPYHKSGLNHEVAMMRDIALYNDYTDVQNTRDKATGKKLEKGQPDFDFYGDLYGKDGNEGTHDPKQTAQNYLKFCYDNNYIPKFDDFMLDENYYKLLIDFRVYDVDGTYAEQQPVQAIYPSNDEFKDLILNGVKDKDGKVYGGLKQQQETSDRLDAETQQIIEEYKQRLAQKGKQFSVKEIIGDSGKSYGIGVYLDSDKLTTLTDDERIDEVKRFIKGIGGREFVAYDKNGNAHTIHIAKATQKFVNKNGKQQYVNKDLTSYLKKEIKQESVVLIDELVANARYYTSQSAKYPHGWIDDYGKNDWEYWKVYIQEKNKTVWEATLDIATSANGDKILYDIYPIEMVERSVTSDAASTNEILQDSDEEFNDEIVNNDDAQHSDKDYVAYDSTALLKESTIDTYLKDYASKTTPNYAQAYITYMSPYSFLELTTKGAIEKYNVERETKQFERDGFEDATRFQPIQLIIDHESGVVKGHEGRHRMVALEREGIYNVPVLLFDSSYMNNKENLNNFKLTGQFNEYRNAVVGEAIPLSYANRDIIIEKFGTMSGMQKMGEKYGWKQTLQYSDKEDSSVYDLVGENKRLEKENAALKADVERLRERLNIEKSVTHGNRYNEKQVGAAARHLLKLAQSDYSLKDTSDLLKELYTFIATEEQLTWEDVYSRSYYIATQILNNAKSDVVEQDFLKDLGMNDVSEAYAEYQTEEMTRWLANEVYNTYWNVSTIVTTADKYENKIKKLNYEHRQTMAKLRDDYNTRAKEKVERTKTLERMYYGRKLLEKDKAIARQKLADDMFYGRIINNMKIRNEQRLDEAKNRGWERLAFYKENAEKKTKIQGITSNVLDLNEKLIKNSKDKHIPEIMKDPVIALLNAIDFSSNRLLEGGEATKKDVSLAKALSKVKDMMVKASNAHEELVELYGHGLDEDIENMMKSVDRIVETIGDNEYILNKMSLEDLQTLDKVVKTIKQAVNKLNKFHTVNHAKGIANLSQESMEYLDSLGKAKLHDGLRGTVSKLLNWNNALPYYVFKRFGEGGMKVYEALQDGWDKFAFNVKAIIDYAKDSYTEKEVNEWSKEEKTFEILVPATEADLLRDNYVPEYQTIKMTIPQIMSMYCLNKREQARGHLFEGGIRVADFKNSKGKIVSQSDGVVFTEKDVSTILDSLSERQKAVADKLQEFMNTVCTDWGNDVSMARFGYKAFGEENYFPIQSDKNNLATDDETEKNNSLFRLLNMSFTKSVVDKANNRIVISDIFDVFAQHTSDMAKYNALALPVLDSFKWYNYKEKEEGGEGTFKTRGVKQSIESAFGKDGQSYFTTFLKDINGQQEGDREEISKKMMRRYKIATVGMNIRVVALQPTSYLRAGAVIENKYLAKALMFKDKARGSAIKMAEKYCGIALWKSMGYYDTNIQRGVVAQIKHDSSFTDKATDISMKGAEAADKMTWGLLWNACELEIRDKRNDLKVGSEEFYQAVGKRLREVIYATQVVDSTMTRSQMMRSSKLHDQIMTNFASEPTLSYNMIQDAYMGYKLDAKRMGKAEALKKNGKRIARIVVAYTLTSAITAAIEAGFDIFRDDEDEEEDVLAMWLENFLSNMSITAKIPYIKEAHSLIKGYGLNRTELEWMETSYKAVEGLYKNVVLDKGNPLTTLKNSLKSASYLSSLPFYNLYRDSMALLDKTEILTSEDLEEMFDVK